MRYIHLLLVFVLLSGCVNKPVGNLHKAAHDGDVATVKSLLANRADPNARDEIKNTPLHYAANHYQREVILLLIGNGADVNAVGAGGLTALHHAVLDSGPETAQLLLEKGANPNVRAINGLTPLDMAEIEGRSATIDLLERNSASRGGLKLDEIPPGKSVQSVPPSNARYKMVVYSPEGKEVSELTHFGNDIVQTPYGGITLVTGPGERISPSLQHFPSGARSDIIDLSTKKVVFTHKY